MAVKVDKLWLDSVFTSLSINSKLLYIYFCTNPQLSYLGVLVWDLDLCKHLLSLSVGELRDCIKELRKPKLVDISKNNDKLIIVVLNHFKTLPKTKASSEKIKEELNIYNSDFRSKLESLGIKPMYNLKKFVKPTPEEVTEYALNRGYVVDGREFVKYYEDCSEAYNIKDYWVDKRGTKVLSWQLKMNKVWCREEKKVQPVKGAPKGKEFFHVLVDGKVCFPDGWRDGKPYSKDFLINKKIKEVYRY